MNDAYSLAPPLQVTQWFNSRAPLTLESLRGRVVLLHAFQMLCPGCVSHGLPQALAVHEAFAADELAVIGLHSVFEHHEAMGPVALKAFLHEYRIPFPVAVDRPAPQGPVPLTMQAYGLRGTPSLILLDRQGRIRLHQFGRVSDLQLGHALGTLLAERSTLLQPGDRIDAGRAAADGCDEVACPLPTGAA